jgi:GNAT superfamily N-acetyltransferase
MAFLESYADTAAHTDDFWRERAQTAATSAIAAQFVAVAEQRWIGSLAVLIRATGQADHLGRFTDDRRALVVGVYVRPESRGAGVIDMLLTAAGGWADGMGLRRIELDVHRDNARAQGAYRRAGFQPTGETLSGPIGPEIVMARPLP